MLSDIRITGVEEEVPVMFLHGIIQNANHVERRTIFNDLLTKLDENFGDVRTFVYVGDEALQENEGCPPAICDSQTALEDNVAKLRDEVETLFRDSGNRKVTLASYSMGGAIIRGYIARHPDEARQFVENVVFLEGVHQGSYVLLAARGLVKVSGLLAEELVAQQKADPLFAKIAGIVVEEIGRQALRSKFEVDIKRPAAVDQTPLSIWYFSVNPKGVVPDINYYNFFGDIGLDIDAQLYIWKVKRELQGRISAGDFVILPGKDDPTAVPILGGARLLAETDPEHVSLQWGMGEILDIELSIALLRRLGEEVDWFSVDADIAGSLFEFTKVAHWNLRNSTGEILVEDRTGRGGVLSVSDEIVAILETP